MPVDIVVPQLGESVVEATVLRWLKREGEPVAAGEPVVELETDKVNVEVPAERAGVLEHIEKPEGATVGIGQSLGTLSDGTGAAAAPPAPNNGGANEGSNGTAVPGLTTKEAVPEPDYGKKQEGAPSEPGLAPPLSGAGGASVPAPPATPVAAKMAEEKNVDLRMVPGSGPGGKVTKEDVANFIERNADQPKTARTIARQAAGSPPSPPIPGGAPAAAPQVASPQGGAGALLPPELGGQGGQPRETRERMSRRRQTIAQRLVEAQRTAAMLTTFNEVDMSAVMEVRKRRRDAFKEKHGVSLGFMSFFTKATVGALKAFPRLNAEIQGDEIVLKHYYDIGIAVSTEEGLVVPVLRDADRKSFAEIEKGIAELAARAREGKLTLPELMGGTFTITNGGVFGSLLSTPILNAPQVGILGMHKIEERPIALNGEVVIRPMMYLALSYDHRIVDGSEAVRFLVRIKELLEDPERLLLEG